MIRSDVLYIGIGSHVAAIQAASGKELWRTKLKGWASYTTVSLRRDGLYAGAAGHLYCLDPMTGAIRWHNELSGLGVGLITFGNTDAAAAAASADAASAASGA